uniref:condensation domain-containing protein n=1 Tax=Staphylococcus xylosus TaxID=1288 RepID=UPI003F55C17D
MEYYELSEAQMRIWYTEKKYPGTTVNILGGTMYLGTSIEIDVLNEAAKKLYTQYGELNCHICECKGIPYRKKSENSVELIEIEHFLNEDKYNEFVDEEMSKPFDILNEKLIKITAFEIEQTNQRGYFLKMHHIISDAWSMINIGNKIEENYINLLNSKNVDNYYADYDQFVKREKEYLKSDRFYEDEFFWLRNLKNIKDNLPFYDNEKSVDLTSQRYTYNINAKLNEKVKLFSENNDISESNFYMGILYIYLHSYFTINNITILTSIHNRIGKNEKLGVGMYVNTVPLQLKLDKNEFSEFLIEIKKQQRLSLKHHKYPFSYIIKGLRNKKVDFNEYISPILYSYQNSMVKNENYHSIWHQPREQEIPLIFNISNRNNDEYKTIEVDYRNSLFSEKYIHEFVSTYINMCEFFVDNKNKDTDFFSNEVSYINTLKTFTQGEKQPISKETLNQIFEKQASISPYKEALVYKDETLNYKELNEKANI